MFDEKTMQAFHAVFHPSLPRLAPGDDRSTRRALESLYGPDLAAAGTGGRPPAILDIGCGNGAQTLHLAAELGGRVTAVDNHAPFLAELERRAAARGLADRVATRCADMHGLEPGRTDFDLVWAEGSAFVVGLGTALRTWGGYLRPGGALGFSDLAWLRDDPPAECRRFFGEEYPAIATVPEIDELLDAAGWDRVARFTLPESSWWGPFYEPLGRRLDAVADRLAGDEAGRTVLAAVRREIDMYRRYAAYYGYVFYTARRRG